tara:strand:- start:151701 stop:152039 length:339 start_codon:yes stop_codon:yes gene_type:complete
MKSVLFSMAVKPGKLEEYKAFAKETLARMDEYSDMMKRYDIHSAKVWLKQIAGTDYVFVYHDVGPNFEEKMQGWESSDHPFDKWFNEALMDSYDIENIAAMEAPEQLFDVKV